MAVYTQLEFAEIEALIAPLQLGKLNRATGVAAGVENTTYFLAVGDAGHTDEFVLTISETLNYPDIEFIAKLTCELNRQGLPVPAPLDTPRGAVLSVRKKPALVVPKIAGLSPQSASPALCHRIGVLMAQLHRVTLSLNYQRDSHRSLAWVATTATALLPLLSPTERILLTRASTDLVAFVSANTELPQAIIHGDLFRDNVLVQGTAVNAIIDFFSAGSGYLLLDLAIAVNDWCFDQQGIRDTANYTALISGYKSVRTPLAEETGCWGQMLRIAALRFWVSRLKEQLIAEPGLQCGRGKNPVPYRELMLRHYQTSPQWPFQ